MIDLIGDIHGHADKLEELLLKLGYAKTMEPILIPIEKCYSLETTLTEVQKLEKYLE